jgi:hypothetical protein
MAARRTPRALSQVRGHHEAPVALVVRDIDEDVEVWVGEAEVLHPVLPSRSRLATQTHTMGS